MKIDVKDGDIILTKTETQGKVLHVYKDKPCCEVEFPERIEMVYFDDIAGIHHRRKK